MDIKLMITSLEAAGYTAKEIADGSGCSVSLVRAIKYDQRGKNPAYKTVEGIKRFYRRAIKKAA